MKLISLLRFGGLFLALLGFAENASAQTQRLHPAFETVDVDDWKDNGGAAVAQDPRYRKQVQARYKSDMEAARWRAIFGGLAREFDSAPRSSDPQGLAAERVFAAQIDGLAHAFELAYSEAKLVGEPDTRAEIAAVLLSVNAAGFGAETFQCTGKRAPAALVGAQPRAGLFLDASLEAELPGEILLTQYDAQNEHIARVPEAVAIDLRLRADTLSSLFALATRDLRADQAKQLAEARTHWDAFLDRGFSQYPWEEWVNGFSVDALSLEPPTHQWIALHPSAAIELDLAGFNSMRVKEALNVELAGYLWYDDDFEDFHGGSLSLLVRDDIGPGIGATFHVNRTLDFGIAWHDVDRDDNWFDDGPMVYCSIDLYRLVEKRAPEWRAKAAKALEFAHLR